MTQDEIIRMAREAGIVRMTSPSGMEIGEWWGVEMSDIERFAALVAAHERERLETPHECQTEGEKTAFAFGWFKAMEQIETAVLAEREACAKVCEERADSYKYATDPWAHEHISEANTCAAAIRMRGNNK